MAAATLREPGTLGRVLTRLDGTLERIVEVADATPEELAICRVNAGLYALPAPEIFDFLERARAGQRPGRALPDRRARQRRGGRSADRGRRARRSRRSAGRQRSRRSRAGPPAAARAQGARAPARRRDALRSRAHRDRTRVGGRSRQRRARRRGAARREPRRHGLDPAPGRLDARLDASARTASSSRIRCSTAPRSATAAGSARSRACARGRCSATARGSATSSRSRTAAWASGRRPTISPTSATPRSATARTSAPARSPATTTASTKHRTEIGDGAFIGSDTMLVAPVRVGARATTGAGSVITRDVPDGALARRALAAAHGARLGRTPQRAGARKRATEDVRNRRIRRTSRGRAAAHRRAAAARVPGLRLGRRRGGRRRPTRDARAPRASSTAWSNASPSSRSAGSYGVAHTRWATHGKPTERNAHPVVDSKNRIAIIHNGIIENFLAIKRRLAAEGWTFATDTDTEVIANLVSSYYTGDLRGGGEARGRRARGHVRLRVDRRRSGTERRDRRGAPGHAARPRSRRGRELPRLRSGGAHRSYPRRDLPRQRRHRAPHAVADRDLGPLGRRRRSVR